MMRIIVSPAKKMRVDTDSFAVQALPQFLMQTERLLARLRELSDQQLQALWKCNDQIAALNLQRLREMDLFHDLTPAILAYEGIQYQYMAPGVFTDGELAYVQDHLRILSGFYGILRPFDGITPYRLEMQAKLSVDGAKDLYAFWGDRLAQALARETNCVINLASKEYSRCISAHLPPSVSILTCTFAERIGDKLVEKGTMCKMARGEMVRFLAQNQVEGPEQLRDFTGLGYRFSLEDSSETQLTFLKEASA
jgi:cytoplasmic iron level regulating protein YaaA (DUF328/UPF0246 family)